MPIFVTQPFLPPLEELLPYLESIWESKVITNNGQYHQLFEEALAKHLGVEHVSLFANCTLALITALQALRIKGEVVTTPYSFVATAHSLIWNGIKPVFVDIEPDSFNLDPSKIERAITPDTTAILAVHCYGYPCKVKEIQEIADFYNLKVIYDAAHAFGVNCDCGSILNHGDLSVVSFHATKVFNTFEGGCIISPDAKTKQRIDRLKNFGFIDETTVSAIGINAKMSEFNSALGLLQLKYVDAAINRRQQIDSLYRNGLAQTTGIDIPPLPTSLAHNHSYFPILINEEFRCSRDKLYDHLKSKGIHARRYFYPLITHFPYYRSIIASTGEEFGVAESVAQRVLCLPIYPDLKDDDVSAIISAINETDGP